MPYVYLIQEQHGLTKIGQTTNVDQRYASLNSSIPYKIDLLYCKEVDDARAAERELHRLFRACREDGEWFNLTDSDIFVIQLLLENLEFTEKFKDEYEQLDLPEDFLRKSPDMVKHELETGMKRCPKCENTYEATLEFFYRYVRGYDGLSTYCKKCQNEYTKKDRRKNRTRYNEYMRDYRKDKKDDSVDK